MTQKSVKRSRLSKKRKEKTLLCIDCNFVKLSLKHEQAQVLVGHIRKEAQWTLDTRRMLVAPKRSRYRPSATAMERAKEWAERELQSIEGSNNAIKRARRKGKATKRKVKDVTVSKTDLVGLMKASLVSDELYRDPSGVRLPIGMASLDRLDPDGHYSLENLRILFTPFNLIRRAAQDDIGITRYLEQIDPGATERADALKKEGVQVPARYWKKDSTPRGAGKGSDWDYDSEYDSMSESEEDSEEE